MLLDELVLSNSLLNFNLLKVLAEMMRLHFCSFACTINFSIKRNHQILNLASS